MTNRKVILILGATIIILSFMGLMLYQSYEEKRAAQEQLQILKGKEEARARAEEEKRIAEQERQKAEERRREAELAEKQKIEQQRKFEGEEEERFKQDMDRGAREERRRIEEEQARVREAERKERRGRAESLKNLITQAETEVDSIKFKLKQIHEWIRSIDMTYQNDKIRASQSNSPLIPPAWKDKMLQDAQSQWEGNKKGAELQLEEANLKLKEAQDKLYALKKQYNDLMK